MVTEFKRWGFEYIILILSIHCIEYIQRGGFLVYDQKDDKVYFDDDKTDIYIIDKKKSKIIPPKMKFYKRQGSNAINHLRNLLTEYKVEFYKEKGKHIMKRLFTQNDFFALIRKGVSYSLATVIFIVLLFGSVQAMDLHFGCEVIVNGKPVGLIKDVGRFKEIMAEIEELTIAAANGEKVDTFSVTYIPRLVSSKDVTPEFKLRQNILADCSTMVESYAIYVDGNMICGSINEADVFAALDHIKNQHADPTKNMTISFDNEVAVRKEYVPINHILTKDGIMAVLTGYKEYNEIYTAYEEDTIWSVAEIYGMTDEAIIELNKGIGPQLHQGQKINVVRKQPLVNVRAEYIDEYIERIPYQSVKVEDSSMAKGSTAVAVSGSEGEKKVVSKVIMINGVEVSRENLEEEVYKNPTNETIKVGTNTNIKSTVAAKSGGSSTGSFLRPNYGIITSRFGYRRRGFHTGLDIAGAYGSNIMAADGGVVICAGWQGSYGKLVKIDHGNGYITYYAHCSSINVRTGQKVQKGQVIAKVGSTGNSTGPHLHFEVRKNGVPQNPLNYIK